MARRSRRRPNPRRVLLRTLLATTAVTGIAWLLGQPEQARFLPPAIQPWLVYAWPASLALGGVAIWRAASRLSRFGRAVPFADRMFRQNQHLKQSSAGWVYVLTHPEMPGLCKIGYTDREPAERARELRTSETGRLPGMKPLRQDFTVAFSLASDYAHQVEQQAHRLLGKRRVDPSREFFRGPVDDMVRVIRRAESHVGQISQEWR